MHTFVYIVARMALGKNIRHLRSLIGDPPRQAIADAINIENDQVIYQLEKRDSAYSKHAIALAEYFGVYLEVLITQDLTKLTLEEIRALSSKAEEESRKSENRDSKGSGKAKKAGTGFDAAAELITIFGSSSYEHREAILNFARDIHRLEEG